MGWAPLSWLEAGLRFQYMRSFSGSEVGCFTQLRGGVEIRFSTAWRSKTRARGVPRAHSALQSPDPGRLFVHVDSGARSVSLVGSFNRWDPDAHPMQRDADGRWTLRVELPPGRHTFAYLVDGERWALPTDAEAIVDDGFGGRVGVLRVWEPKPCGARLRLRMGICVSEDFAASLVQVKIW